MRIDSLRIHRIRLPLRSPFETSFKRQTEREALILELGADVDGREAIGWGECVALPDPSYSAEYNDAASDVIQRFLVPLLAERDDVTAETLAHDLRKVCGHRMAKAAIEMAVLDAELRARGVSMAEHLGGVTDRVPSGVSVGIHESPAELVDAVEGYLDEGYVRIKIKIKPGHDIDDVRAVREAIGHEVPLQVDANAAYGLVDARHLARLDEFGLLLIEQPLAEDDLVQHAALASRLSTPICLDESIVSTETASAAIALGATEVINIKPGRVGGYLTARRIHDIARASGVPVWCGGMLETGLGRAGNAALASLPGFTLVGDISASDRFYLDDITEPFELNDGHIAVPSGPGLGVEPIRKRLEQVTLETIAVEVRRRESSE